MSAKNLEAKLIQAYTSLAVTLSPVDSPKSASLDRWGAYEVRLFEPSQITMTEAIPFWVELFDHKTKTSLDIFGSVDIEEVARVADELISRAKKLNLA
jgi:hypothetical protein